MYQQSETTKVAHLKQITMTKSKAQIKPKKKIDNNPAAQFTKSQTGITKRYSAVQ